MMGRGVALARRGAAVHNVAMSSTQPPVYSSPVTTSEEGPAGPAGAAPWWRRPLRAVPAIIGLNLVVFFMWRLGAADQAWREFMIVNFLTSPYHLAHGLWWTVLTSAFSHNALWHIAINMIVLWSFGAVLERLWGVRTFVFFYLAAALVSSLSYCAVALWFLDQPNVPALGASGAITGLLMAYALIFPRQKILVMGIIPVPAFAGVMAFVAWDVWGLFVQRQGGGLPIAHGAHLGGALAGAVMCFAFLKPGLARATARGDLVLPPSMSRREAAELKRLQSKVREQGPESLTPDERRFLVELKRRFDGSRS